MRRQCVRCGTRSSRQGAPGCFLYLYLYLVSSRLLEMPPSTGTPLRDRMSGSKQQAAGVSDARNGRGNARARGSSAGGARAARAEQRMAHGTHRAASATSTQADRRTSTSSAYPVLILHAIATKWCLPSRGRGRKSGGGQAVAVTPEMRGVLLVSLVGAYLRTLLSRVPVRPRSAPAGAHLTGAGDQPPHVCGARSVQRGRCAASAESG